MKVCFYSTYVRVHKYEGVSCPSSTVGMIHYSNYIWIPVHHFFSALLSQYDHCGLSWRNSDSELHSNWVHQNTVEVVEEWN